DEPAPFSFDFGQKRQHSEQPPAAEVAPKPADAPITDDEHDTIADLIAAELLGAAPAPAQATPVAAPMPIVEAAPVEAAPPSPVVPKIASWTPASVALNSSDQPAPARPTLRPVNLTPIHRTEKSADSFRVPPVFGLGTSTPPVEPAAPAPEPVAPVKPHAEHGYLQPVVSQTATETPADTAEADFDPIDEIESLIGRAVRVELDSPREPQPEPERPIASPALRSLATPTAPPPVDHPMSGVDEAILAAAAATGAEVGWVEPNEDHQTMVAEPRERAPRRAGMLRAFAGPLVAVALLLAAGFGLYSVLGLGGSNGPAPVLVADTSPIKQVPEAKAPVDQVQQSIVFNEMNGVVPGAEEQLVSRDQADVNEVTAMPPPAAITDEGLANRKVRTVTVRPDGTIVSGGDESVAGAAILPVDRPNVPAVPGAAAPSEALLASANAMQPTPAAAASVAPLVPGTEIAVVDAAGTPIAGKTAPLPYLRPASVGDAPPTGPVTAIVDTPLQPVSTEVPVANAQQPTAQATTAPPTNAPAYAQLSSQRSPEVAQQIANDLSARY
ncbi:MAG TPA: hypothetical protein VL147_05290, partial [Devosia sp.]|nr:hypothetical protein [Devosia sp.]